MPFFLFQTGVVYEVAGDPEPSSIALSKSKMDNLTVFIYESEVFSASWLSNFGNLDHMLTYSDTVSLTRVLTAYSEVDRRRLLIISDNVTGHYAPQLLPSPEIEVKDMSYIYLRQDNVLNGILTYDRRAGIIFNVTDVPVFNTDGILINKIYSNSASEIYYRSP